MSKLALDINTMTMEKDFMLPVKVSTNMSINQCVKNG